MLKSILSLCAMASLIALPSFASAADVDCASECPSGETMASFTDGNVASCRCEPAAVMDETVEDPSVDPNAESYD